MKNDLLRWSYTFLSHRDLSSAHKGDVFLGLSTEKPSGMVTEGTLKSEWLDIPRGHFSPTLNANVDLQASGSHGHHRDPGHRRLSKSFPQPYLGGSTCHRRVHQSQLVTGPCLTVRRLKSLVFSTWRRENCELVKGTFILKSDYSVVW